MNKTAKKKPTLKENDETHDKQSFNFIETTIPTIYVNHAQFLSTGYDLGVLIGEVAGVDVKGVLQVIPRAKLIMADEFVKEFVSLLVRNTPSLQKVVAEQPNPVADNEDLTKESKR